MKQKTKRGAPRTKIPVVSPEKKSAPSEPRAVRRSSLSKQRGVSAFGVRSRSRRGEASNLERTGRPQGKAPDTLAPAFSWEDFSEIDVAVVVLDGSLGLRRYTPAAADIFHMTPTDLGRSFEEVASRFSDAELPADLRTVQNGAEIGEKEVLSGPALTHLRRIRAIRGTDGTVRSITIIWIDISSRKTAEINLREAEARHQLILSGIHEYGIFLLDPEGRYVTWTAGAEKILGYTEAEARGRPFSLIMTAEDRAANRADRDLARAEVDRQVLVERWYIRKDDSKFWGTAIISTVYGEGGKPSGFVILLRDSTDHKRSEDNLRKAMIHAEAANASKDHFLANVSHELRTPLAATLLWSKLLSEQKDLDPGMLQEGLSAIHRSVREQQALIDDLMDTAKIVAGKMRLERSRCELNSLIQAMLPPFRTQASEIRVTITEKLDRAVGTVEADPRRLQQVISNLISNAVKFTPQGGRIDLATVRKGDMVEIVVTDTGKGISPQFLTKIFDRFVQVESAITPTASGMGLGLAIARQLIELHGGSIHAESDGPDRGTRFIIVVPLPAQTKSRHQAPAAESPLPTLRDRRVLLVEDSQETRLALSAVLHQAGAEVVSAATVTEALAEFERSKPDLILSDIGLGASSGHALIAQIRLREIQRQLPLTPALALTAYADERNRRKAFESGFQDCATKPIEPRVLVAKLVNLQSAS